MITQSVFWIFLLNKVCTKSRSNKDETSRFRIILWLVHVTVQSESEPILVRFHVAIGETFTTKALYKSYTLNLTNVT